MIFHDCNKYYSPKQNQIMELTKQDKKHIDEQVRKLSFRIVEEAKEYMRLYERTYYEEVINMCEQKIETIDELKEMSKKISDK
mgnify:CR=1 FL=1